MREFYPIAHVGPVFRLYRRTGHCALHTRGGVMSYEQRIGCWKYLVTAVALAGAVGCSGGANPAAPTAAAPDASSQVGAVSGGALLGQPNLGPDLAAVRAATAMFHQVERAIAAGYADPTGGHCDEIGAGAMGIHSPNAALIQSQVLDPERPEVLLYMPKEEGGFR